MAKRSTTLVGIALALAVLAAGPAAASFPGRNGEIVLIEENGSRQGEERVYLHRFPPPAGESLGRQVCTRHAEPPACTHLGRPAFTPDGSRFAAAAIEPRSPSTSASTLWLLTADGQRVESHPLASYYSELRWSPDASALVASGAPDGAVVVLNPDGSERERVAAHASQPDWCANGRMILVKHGEIRVVRADGSLRRLTWHGGSEPSCSPNGRRVAFTRAGVLWTVPLSGGRARRLTKGYRPVWSPDGRQIAYLHDRPHPEAERLTYLYRIGLRRQRVRLVSNEWTITGDAYSDAFAYGPEWRPLPRR
jgi:Tol biopolymer transport system component